MSTYIPVHDQRNIWLYWEHRPGVSIEPPHVRLCRKAIYRHAGNATVHLVTPENLYDYLPDFPKKAENIRVKNSNDSSIALKCDVIRAMLLKKYGGLYLDSDTIPLKPMGNIFNHFQEYDFVGMQCETHGDNHIPVGVYGSRLNGVVLSEYVAGIRRKLFFKILIRRKFGWTSLGQSILTRVVNRHRELCHLWPENLVQPITYHRQKLFSSTEIEPEDIIPPDALFFTLYHSVFETELAGITEDELLRGNMLVSKVFRQALEVSN
jgi:hypothetical protein